MLPETKTTCVRPSKLGVRKRQVNSRERAKRAARRNCRRGQPRPQRKEEEEPERPLEDLEPSDKVAPDAERQDDVKPATPVDPAVSSPDKPPEDQGLDATAEGNACDASKAASEAEPPSSELAPELLILLDWDDTIMPTTYLQRRGIDLMTQEVPEDVAAALKAYGEHAANTVRALLLHGNVVIVTNAEWGWV
jgi:hypothetical protein